MSRYIEVETPGGLILAEIDDSEDLSGIELVGIREKLPTFAEACASLKRNADFILNVTGDLAPDEVEISCGIKVGAEGGNVFWGLAKTSGEATYSITLKWKVAK
ncbi:MAG: hypothetical protein KJ069_21415 [Anaerolineae bacterium]|nr:hypothetical protein [Anaerolineae bacterium]